MELENIPLSLHSLLRRVVTLMKTMAGEKLTTLEIEIAPDAPDEIIGDPMRLSQVSICSRDP